MKLTFSVICEALVKTLGVNAQDFRCVDDEPGIIGVGNAVSSAYKNELVYVINGNSCRPFPANCIIIGGDELPPIGVSFMRLPDSVSAAEVEAALVDAFIKYEHWQNELLEKIARGDDWYSIVDTAHDVLQNPMIIYDVGMKVLSYTVNDGSDDELWKDTVASGTASTGDMQESEELLKYVRRFENDNRPFKHKGENMTDPFYSCNILVQSKRSGMVCLMEHNHEISRGETDLLRIFCSILTLKMLNDGVERVSKEDMYRELLYDLLEGNIASRQRLNTRLLAAGWNVGRYFVVMQFTSSISYITGAQWKIAIDDFSRMGLDGICCMVNEPGPFICAVSSLTERSQLEKLLPQIEAYCRTNHLRCGVSDIFEDLIQVPRYWDQAVSALELGNSAVSEYASVRMKKLVDYIKEHRYSEDILSPEILKLKETDDAEGTEYCATLRALCESSFRQTEAADRLSIHRTTLTYRLQKISELTGLDFSDHEKILHAWFTLRII